MKTALLLTLLTFFIPHTAEESPIDLPVYKSKASFMVSYNRIRKYEGFYSNHPEDKGGKTYVGIAYNYNKDWMGWQYVDKHDLKWNEYVTGKDSAMVEYLTLDYYLTIWVNEGFDRLRDQRVADYLFDTRIHLSKRQTIKLIRNYGIPIPGFDPSWVHSKMGELNLEEFSKIRMKYYQRLIDRNPEQKVFFYNWSKRANDC